MFWNPTLNLSLIELFIKKKKGRKVSIKFTTPDQLEVVGVLMK
jgi:hypothetical protein